jgi:tRNA-2-methylthio-N6-dimethylallyladenosine synthase
MKFFIRTFGCQMNKHDSERIAGLLLAHGFEAAPLERADVIILNTCAVREHAVERVAGYVNSLGSHKKRGALIAVGGCVAAAEKEALFSRSRLIDIVFGPDDIYRLPALIEEARGGAPVVAGGGADDFFASDLPVRRDEWFRAWIAITKGCDNFCSYCIVPHVRGREKSRQFDDILAEVDAAVADGVREVFLLGQNVNSYGRDLYGEPQFARLLAAVAERGPRRVRFATSHPRDFSRDIIDVIATHENVCPQVHLPIQSGSSRILELMNRHYTKEQYLEKALAIRERIPEAGISTDIIVGFPGETEEDFEETLDVVRTVQFDQVYTFIFSPRPFTKAASMPDETPAESKAERFARLTALVKEITLERNEKLVGKNVEVLVEGPVKRGKGVTGRAPDGRVVTIAHAYEPGELVTVRITGAGPHHLVGEPVREVVEATAGRRDGC